MSPTLGTVRGNLPNAFRVTGGQAQLQGQILGFRYTAPNLHCWRYTAAGAYDSDVASVAVPSGAPVPGNSVQEIAHAVGGTTGVPLLMWSENGTLIADAVHREVMIWSLPGNTLVRKSYAAPAGSSQWGADTPFVPPGEASGYAYFFANYDSPVRTELYRVKVDGGAAPELIVAAPVTGLTLLVPKLVDPSYVYIHQHGSAPNEKLYQFPLAGGTATETNVRSLFQGTSPIYHAGVSGNERIWFGRRAAGRRQRRYVHDETQAFKFNYADAFTVDAPNTSTGNVSMTINRSGNTGGYFPWNTGLSSVKLSQPQGTTASSGHSTDAPEIVLASHPTHGLPQWVHLNEYAHSW